MLQVVTDSDMISEVHNNEKKISYSQSYFYNGHDPGCAGSSCKGR